MFRFCPCVVHFNPEPASQPATLDLRSIWNWLLAPHYAESLHSLLAQHFPFTLTPLLFFSFSNFLTDRVHIAKAKDGCLWCEDQRNQKRQFKDLAMANKKEEGKERKAPSIIACWVLLDANRIFVSSFFCCCCLSDFSWFCLVRKKFKEMAASG